MLIQLTSGYLKFCCFLNKRFLMSYDPEKKTFNFDLIQFD